ncbi:MAG: alpha/beta hydrolase [Ruminococcus sp.]|nr:alpha/beta hydrolase [Ruminococcus sp.]
MKVMLIHGLGQTAKAWEKTAARLDMQNDLIITDLVELSASEQRLNYNSLYKRFAEFTDEINEPLYLCGLSLGGILAMQYTISNPRKVKSLVLIGTQYKMPKAMLTFQNILFKFMPEKSFSDTGFDKSTFISLCASMKSLDFTDELTKIHCPTLIICGEKDKANKAAALELHKKILDSRLEIINDCTHEVNVCKPDELAKLMLDFIN